MDLCYSVARPLASASGLTISTIFFWGNSVTCEVAVLNRLAIVLAADSAVTFAGGDSSDTATAFATGANKIFQLSSIEPVAAMIFNNANMQDVPWELILKSFRQHINKSAFPSMHEYAQALSDFITNNATLFPAAHREKHFQSLAARSVLEIEKLMQESYPGLFDASQTPQQQTQTWQEFVTWAKNQLASIPLPSWCDQADIQDAINTHQQWLSIAITTYFSNEPTKSHLQQIISVPELTNLAIEGVFKFHRHLFGGDYTGVVIAGFGQTDCFPSYVETRYYGFIRDKLVVEEVRARSIDHETGSIIEAFATKSMVETFMQGASPTVWQSVRDAFKTATTKISEEVKTSLGVAALPQNWQDVLDKAQEDFMNEWSRDALSKHYRPLRNVISGLSIEEMAELAETLVMLESLKEKVTYRTQSVGGPVDVAVITRSEGLVWLRRKLFFDPQLNHRYFLRQQHMLT